MKYRLPKTWIYEVPTKQSDKQSYISDYNERR